MSTGEAGQQASVIRNTTPAVTLSRELGETGEEAFRLKYPHPFLLVDKNPMKHPGLMELRTVEANIADLDQLESLSQDTQALALCKSDRNTFMSMITVGRATNNDLVIRTPKISKLHASFSISADGTSAVLEDMGSVNGTWVNELKLEKKKPARVENDNLITFWRYKFTFKDLDSFTGFLRGI